MKRAYKLIWIMLLIVIAASGCSTNTPEMREGYFTAVAADFDDYGWKEYVTICISDGRIVSAEYDARNATGFIKSWDMSYMRIMHDTDGTYPNEYTRLYADGLVTRQHPDKVDAISGATHSHISFQLLAQASIDLAHADDGNIIYIDLPVIEETEESEASIDTL